MKTRHTRHKCKICHSHEIDVLSFDHWMLNAEKSKDERKKIAEIVKDNFKKKNIFNEIHRCRSCQFITIDKIPQENILNAFYDNYYANKMYGDKKTQKIKRVRKRIKRIIRRYKNKSNANQPRTLIDIGCNLGFAVQAAIDMGLSATGIEIDQSAIQYARQTFPKGEFLNQNITQFLKHERTFDIVYCAEVLEHVPDFVAVSNSLKKLIAPNGILFLTTPDAAHWRVPEDIITWKEVKPPEHIQLFSKTNLEKLFCGEDLEIYFRRHIKPGIRMFAIRR